MIKTVLGSLFIAGLMAGCSKPQPPSNQDVEAFVRQHAPEGFIVRGFTPQATEPTGADWRMRFEATVSPTIQLYEAVDLDVEFAQLEWKPGTRAQGMKPALIRETLGPSQSVPVSGEVMVGNNPSARFRDFKWNLDSQVHGQPRAKFPESVLTWGSDQANAPVRRYLQLGKFASLPAADGTYRDAKFDTLYPDSVLVVHAKGVVQVKFEDLPPALQMFFPVDENAVRQAKAESRAVERQRQEAARQRAYAEETEVADRRTREANRPPEPPSNVDDIIGEYLHRATTAHSTILVRTSSATFDDTAWAWRVECDYSYDRARNNSVRGGRIEGKSYVWFRDKLLVRWRDIVPPRSPYN